MKDIDKMSSNELRAEVRVLRVVYEAAQVVALEVIPHKPEGDLPIINLNKAIAAVEALDEK